MAMTPAEMFAFFEEQAGLSAKGFERANESGNYYLAVSNLGQTFKSLAMQGLIGWRCELGSPVAPFQQAVLQMDRGKKLLAALKPAEDAADLPAERAGLIAPLVDAPAPSIPSERLTADRLLDAVLAQGLQGAWNLPAWNAGLDQLRKRKGAALAVDSYETYARLLACDPADAGPLVELAAQLFDRRAKDGFFRGGEQTEGGGPDNKLTVDYRLAAVMKRIGYAGPSAHRWRWS